MKNENVIKRKITPLLHHKVFMLIIILAGLVVLFTVWSLFYPSLNFFQISTVRTILNSIVLSAFLAIGAGCLLIGGHLDLSQALVGAFSGIVLAVGIKAWNLPFVLALFIALLVCAVLGAINALMVTKFRFPSFIATLAMASMAQGLMYMFSAFSTDKGTATNVPVPDNPVLTFIGGSIGSIPFGIIVMAVFFLFYGILVAKTKFGLKMMLLGGNPVAANLAGIKSKKITTVLFINSAVMGGVAGIFNTARLGQGNLLALTTNQFTGLTAAILGGISFGGGAGGMGGAFVGLLILNTFQIGMQTVGVNPFWVNVFSGVILLAALTTDFLAQRRAAKV